MRVAGLNAGPGRREQILEESRRILEEQGLEALTMRNLAAAMDIKAPSLYKHIKDREEIELLLTEVAFRELGAALAESSPDLGAMAGAYRGWALSNPALYRIATSRALDRENLSAGLEAGAEAPLLEALGNSRDLARSCWAMAHGLVDLELNDRFPPGADIDAAWARGVAAFSAQG